MQELDILEILSVLTRVLDKFDLEYIENRVSVIEKGNMKLNHLRRVLWIGRSPVSAGGQTGLLRMVCSKLCSFW